MRELVGLASSAQKFASELGVKSAIHLDDHIFRFLIENRSFYSVDYAVRYYFYDGQESARKLGALLQELALLRPGQTTSMLEFASGYGCVSRHLAMAIPGLRSVACDIHAEAITFLEKELGVHALLSRTNPDEFKAEQHKIVFALSFFSHMPRRTWGAWIKALYASVASGGALVFTTHGQISRKHFNNAEIPSDGFWFHQSSEQKDLDTADYGQTIVTEAFVRGELRRQIGKEPEVFREAFWWNHQDLYVVHKP